MWVRLYYYPIVGGNWQFVEVHLHCVQRRGRVGGDHLPGQQLDADGKQCDLQLECGCERDGVLARHRQLGGREQLLHSGSLSSDSIAAVNGLPTNGSTVYATLYSLVSGTWMRNAYTYTAFNAAAATGMLTTPMPGSNLTSGTVTFSWTAGSGASAYWMDIGATAGGNNYYSSGNLGNVLTTTVSGLPTDGSTVYVTLYSLIGANWVGNAYTYTALNATGGLAAMQTPTW